jgi:outer membrane protein TolC
LKRASWKWTIGLVLVFFFGGCGVNETREVQIYREVLDARTSGAAPTFQPGAPLSLINALEMANARSEQLDMAGETYLQALIDKDRAFAAFLPRISLVPTFMAQPETAYAADNELISAFEPTHATDVPLVGKMDLHPFRDVPAARAAGASARAQRALLLDRQAVLMLDVARAYFQVLHAENQVEVLAQSVLVSRQRLADMRAKAAAGVGRPVDVALIEAQLAKTRYALIGADDDVKNGRTMLAYLIGVPAIDGPLTGGTVVPSTDWQIDPLLKKADAHRQDLIAAHEQVGVAAVALEAAWGEYFPSVSLELTRYLSRETFPDDVDWTSLIQVHVPLFSAGLTHMQVRTAYSLLRQARLAEQQTRRRIRRDIQVAFEHLKDDTAQIEQLGIRREAAREGMQHADVEFEAGIGTALQRLVAQEGFLSAELALAEAQYKQNVDYLTLLRVTGMLHPDLSLEPAMETNRLSTKKIKR